MEEQGYILYCHTNKINGKRYIGITKQKPQERWGKDGRRYKDSPKFWNAIQKYGWDGFDHIVLLENLTQEDACKKEAELIEKYHLTDDNFGYNMTTGGEKHYIFTPEVKQKLREQKLGEKNPQYGKEYSQEEREHLRQTMRAIGQQGGNHCKKVQCIETGIIYYSCQEAARNTGSGKVKQASHIADVCNGKRNKCNNYTWRWIVDDINGKTE